MSIKKINITIPQAIRLLPINIAYLVSKPGVHIFASFNEEELKAIVVVKFDGGKKHPYTIKFIGCGEESYIDDCVELIRYIENHCKTKIVCEFAGNEEYLKDVALIMKAAGYTGEDSKERYIEYDATTFMISPLGAALDSVMDMAKKLKGYSAFSTNELAAFTKACGKKLVKDNDTKYFCKDGKILGMITAEKSEDSAVYVKDIQVADNNPRTLSVLLAYAINLAFLEDGDNTIIFKTGHKGLINGLLENLGEPATDTPVKIYM